MLDWIFFSFPVLSSSSNGCIHTCDAISVAVLNLVHVCSSDLPSLLLSTISLDCKLFLALDICMIGMKWERFMRINKMWGNKIRKFAVKLQIKLNCSEQREKNTFMSVAFRWVYITSLITWRIMCGKLKSEMNKCRRIFLINVALSETLAWIQMSEKLW
jgi:hypothetical protein